MMVFCDCIWQLKVTKKFLLLVLDDTGYDFTIQNNDLRTKNIDNPDPSDESSKKSEFSFFFFLSIYRRNQYIVFNLLLNYCLVE